MKNAISELALFGGPKLFASPVHVGTPNAGDRAKLMERLNAMLDRRWFSNAGPLVGELEQRIAERLGVRHAIAICNGTVALEIAIRALDLSGEVLVPSFTFIATAHALEWQRIRPVFCDIDSRTHRLDPADVESRITPRTTGIIGVHTWGEPCAITELTDIARRHGLRLLFDASHAFDCSDGVRPIGGFGHAEVFSLHATKFFHTLEGGAITTNNDDLAARIRLMRNFGFAGYDRVIELGINGKMNEASGAMGLTNLEILEEFVAANAANYRLYSELLRGIPGVSLFPICTAGARNYQYVVAEIDETAAGISRDRLVELLHAENVLARRYFYPGCHRMQPYAEDPFYRDLKLPATEEVCGRVLVLPTGTAVEPPVVKSICGLLRFIIENSAAIARR